MRIFLVAPRRGNSHDGESQKGAEFFRIPPIGLLNVAAITPDDIEVQILDENVRDLTYDDLPDLVGVSVMTASALQAYGIADRFRELGVPVVLGGTHVSLMTGEGLEHADAIVVGEAEGAWEQLVEDFRKNGKAGLKKTYKLDEVPDLAKVPFPRLELARDAKDYLFTNLFNITRGCPHDCSFCSVTQLLGRKVRYRPVKDVVDHIKETLEIHKKREGKLRLQDRLFIFVDDNIMANKRYAKELFRALIPFKIMWISQTSINSAYDDELIDLAAQSGCKGVFIGFESVSKASLKEIGKSQNDIDFYKTGVKKFHKKGIFVEGAFIFGFDYDEPDVFQETVKYVNEMHLDGVQYTILTPLPGTSFYEKIEKEGRFLDRNWSHYDCTYPVYRPEKMSAETLQQGLFWAYKSTYSFKGILKRTFTSLFDRRWKFFVLILAFNIGYRRAFQYMFEEAVNPAMNLVGRKSGYSLT